MSSTAQSDPPDNSGATPGKVSLLTRFIATGMFSGYIPWASGTFGSMVGLLLFAIPGATDPWTLAVMILAGFAIGVFTSGRVAAVEGHRLTSSAAATKALFQPGEHDVPDPSIVVIDEIVGMWISLWLLPPAAATVIAAFIFFRIMDVVKPPPARQLERIPNGWGIMLDDVVAGIYANLCVRVLFAIIGYFFPGIV